MLKWRLPNDPPTDADWEATFLPEGGLLTSNLVILNHKPKDLRIFVKIGPELVPGENNGSITFEVSPPHDDGGSIWNPEFTLSTDDMFQFIQCYRDIVLVLHLEETDIIGGIKSGNPLALVTTMLPNWANILHKHGLD